MTQPLEDQPMGIDAVHWFNRLRSGDMTTSESRAYEVWLGEHSDRVAEMKAVERHWAFLGDMEDDPVVMGFQDRAEKHIAERARSRVFGALAAGAVIVAGGGWALMEASVLPTLGWLAPAKVESFRTGIGERKRVVLADGSVVTLDTDTILDASISGRQRQITLERGQASFDVAKEKGRPFLVTADGKTVRATGTVFDVRVGPGRFEVTLIEGRVQVQRQGADRDEGPMANMRPGWKLAVGEDARWRMEPVDLVKETSWHNGVLTFYEDPLVVAVAEMNRYSRRKIVFKGAPPETFVMGNFEAGDVDNFIRAVELNKLARVASNTENQVELMAR